MSIFYWLNYASMTALFELSVFVEFVDRSDTTCSRLVGLVGVFVA